MQPQVSQLWAGQLRQLPIRGHAVGIEVDAANVVTVFVQPQLQAACLDGPRNSNAGCCCCSCLPSTPADQSAGTAVLEVQTLANVAQRRFGQCGPVHAIGVRHQMGL